MWTGRRGVSKLNVGYQGENRKTTMPHLEDCMKLRPLVVHEVQKQNIQLYWRSCAVIRYLLEH